MIFLYLLAAAVSLGVVYAVTTRKNRPIYGDDPVLADTKRFKLYAVISLAVSAVVNLIFFAKNGLFDFNFFNLSTVSLIAVVTFVMLVSFYTDPKYRKVDRFMLRAAIAVAVIFGIAQLIVVKDEVLWVSYVAGVLIFSSLVFIPNLGASDVRALALIFAAGVPAFGLIFTYYALIGSVVLWLGYGIFKVIKEKTTKVSIPMVPYVLAPFTFVAILSVLTS